MGRAEAWRVSGLGVGVTGCDVCVPLFLVTEIRSGSSFVGEWVRWLRFFFRINRKGAVGLRLEGSFGVLVLE